jgi:hypothetical protein
MRRIAFAALVTCAAAAHADATLTYVHEHDRSPALTVAIGHGRLRTDMGAAGAVIVEPQPCRVVALDPGAQRYAAFDPAQVAALGTQLGAVREQMRGAMAGMSPEQRAQLEQMMGGSAADLLGGEGVPAPALERTGEHARYGGRGCERARLRAGADPAGEVCIAPAGEVGLGAAEQAVLEAAFGCAQQLAEPLRAQGIAPGFDPGAFPRGQVLVRSAMPGEPAQVLDAVSGAPLDASLFSVPPGWQRQELPAIP